MKRWLLTSLILALSLASACAMPEGKTPSEKKAYTRLVRDAALRELYVRDPVAKQQIESAPGYAFLSGFSMHPGVLTFANAYGIVQNNTTGKQVHVRLTRLGIGPGIAVKGYYVIAVLNDDELARAEQGEWGGGGLAEASFKFGDTGGSSACESYDVDSETWQWTHTGVALELALVGGRVSPKDDLN